MPKISNSHNSEIKLQKYIYLVLFLAFLLLIVFRNKEVIDSETWARMQAFSANSGKTDWKGMVIWQNAWLGLVLFPLPMFICFYQLKKSSQFRKSIRTKEICLPDSNKELTFSQRLLLNFPTLTVHEIKLCEMLKNGMTSKEIAGDLNISPASVNTARYRLRKKLKLKSSQDLVKFLADF